MKSKYFMNGFRHLYDCFVKADSTFEYFFYFPKSSRWDVFTNYLGLRKKIKETGLKEYDIIHINCWENILQYNPCKKRKDQITIAEAHGYFVGVNFDATIRELPIQKRIPNMIIKFLFDKKMQRRLKEYDLFYVSTPNMLEHAKKLRKDALWLPNPIDTALFTSRGKKVKLEGNPAVFLPTRLHAFKNPLFGINLFKKIKSKYPDAKLHMINYGQGADPLFIAFKKIVDARDVIYHNRMPREELAAYYRSADLVLGQFNESLGNLSLIELEAMACGAPLVTLDKYEIKNEYSSLDQLEGLTFKLLRDKKFKKIFIDKNIRYVNKIHSAKSVVKILLNTIKCVRKSN